jgi:polar amino acid transport system substrate-binding protein
VTTTSRSQARFRRWSDGLNVLPATFRQDYGFALPSGSPLRERVNRTLLAEMRRVWFRALIENYLGTSDAATE